MKEVKNQILIDINKIADMDKLVQIFELTLHKLSPKTISHYAAENKMSYNGVKNHRNKIDIDGVKFVVDGINKNNLPF